MNATRVPQSVPTPPDRILLKMSEEEARVLYRVCIKYPTGMPVDFRNDIVHALILAGTRW